MKMDTLILGDFQTNCYIVRPSEKTKKCLVIDPGMDPAPLLQTLQAGQLKPVLIFLTHGHVDHIAGVELLREQWPRVEVAIHKDDAEMLTDPVKNLSMLAGSMVQARPADTLYESEETLELAGMSFELLHTPGHTPGGICLYSESEGMAFVGDTLFAGAIGRFDFEGGNYEQLIEGIQTKLLSLPEETKIYPGHGPATTVRREKLGNPFFTAFGSF